MVVVSSTVIMTGTMYRPLILAHAEAGCYDSMASVKVWVDARGGTDT
jgi:hypothetical protein